MGLTADERLEQARRASDANRFAEQYRLLLPLAEAGHPEAMAWVGSLLHIGAHRHETFAALEEVPAADPTVVAADQAQAARYLQAASDAGVGAASYNLASLVMFADGYGTWAERKARAATLYALAYSQGFAYFGLLMNRGGDGQPYLDLMEDYAVTSGNLLPGMTPPPEVSARARATDQTGANPTGGRHGDR